MNRKEPLEFWKHNTIKALIMAGFTYFSVAASTQDLTFFLPALIAGGSYFFVEAARYYGIYEQARRVTYSEKAKKHFHFLI